jgi:hypothetical protein
MPKGASAHPAHGGMNEKAAGLLSDLLGKRSQAKFAGKSSFADFVSGGQKRWILA